MAIHHLKLTFDVHIAEWRIDDPRKPENNNWSLEVFDENLGQWIRLTDCTRPGESHMISKIEYLGKYEPEEASGSTPEDLN